MGELRPVPKPKFKRYKPKRVNRGKFDRLARLQIIERDGGVCQECGAPGTQIHHVKPKSSGKGRGVVTNGMLVCQPCHTRLHRNNDRLKFWQEVFKERYGTSYYKDVWD